MVLGRARKLEKQTYRTRDMTALRARRINK
jgi:hypothetical protein